MPSISTEVLPGLVKTTDKQYYQLKIKSSGELNQIEDLDKLKLTKMQKDFINSTNNL